MTVNANRPQSLAEQFLGSLQPLQTPLSPMVKASLASTKNADLNEGSADADYTLGQVIDDVLGHYDDTLNHLTHSEIDFANRIQALEIWCRQLGKKIEELERSLENR